MLKQKLFKTASAEGENKRIKLTENSNTNNDKNESSISKYFTKRPEIISEQILNLQDQLNDKLSSINFCQGKVSYVYNPTIYASEPYKKYVRRFCTDKKKILFVGMNPGPHGMCQTGIPFGNVENVARFLNINGNVTKPLRECPNRPIYGFNCIKKEPSGYRFWSFFEDMCKTPDLFFKNSFLYNYCPLALMKDNGTNVTPAELQADQKKALEEICDPGLLEVIKLLEPEILIAIGAYAETKIKKILKNSNNNFNIKVLNLPHPSPRSIGNTNWPEKAKKFFETNNLQQYFI